MEWQQLIGFYHVVTLQSYTKAAMETFRTQSALSQQIKKLEETLDCKLIDRVGRGVQLTTAGRALFRHAQRVLNQEEQFLEELAEIKGERKGKIRLTAPNGTFIFQLADVLNAYRRRYPDVMLHMFECAPQTSVDMVLDGSMDFCITHESVIPKTFAIHPWSKGQYVLMAPHGHPLTQLKKVQIEDVVKYPLILPQKNARRTARRSFDRIVTQKGLEYRTIFETGNTSINAEFVKLGFGISFILSFHQYRVKHGKDIAFIPMKDLFPDENISIGVRKGHVLSATKQAFLNFLLEHPVKEESLRDPSKK